MPNLTLDKQTFALDAGETVLDCLLRNQVPISYACKSGACQSCLVQAVDCRPDDKAANGLKSTLQADGYALACQWQPAADIQLRLPDMTAEAATLKISELAPLNTDILRVRLAFAGANNRFSSRPGQYLNLVNPGGVARSYSIANDSTNDDCFELHIARAPQGEFTHWLFNEARCGQVLHARGPAGDCFYVPEGGQNYPILLAGTGTGLAPLYGIIRDALAQGHKGPITLLHGGSRPERLYYVDELLALAALHPNFSYQALVLSDTGGDARLTRGDLAEAVLAALDTARLAEQRVYLCGAPEFVQDLRKRAFLKGVRSAHIHCDAFVTRKVEPAQTAA